ncbi:MAG TPA: DUF1385 domain-containing protein [Dissulfurispiraceae bacterium]|nr:DUF1385 domain-containing protein [Dissulfurispiraceae bacterium]
MNHVKNIGGQAVIEGVMMKSPKGWSVAVRNPKGEINLKTVETKEPPKIFKMCLVRGVIALFQALYIGIKAIEYSGTVAFEGENEKAPGPLSMALSIGAAFLLAVGLFIVLPLYLTKLVGMVSQGVAQQSILFNLVDGLLRVGIFLLYVFTIGMWREMRRIYEYHGAEHKVIYAYEAGEALTVENARKYRPYHPRCGTSFLLIVMVISILIFSLIPQHWPFIWKAGARIVLMPVIAGISYEILRYSAKMKDSSIMGLITLPGLLLQRLTVREPDEAQIEVALAAVEAVLAMEGQAE